MNTASRSPLLGCNTEVLYKGTTYHVQTEDSGTGHPHVITHLFAGGGRIIASRKTDYAVCVGTPKYPDLVKELIRVQHKEMIVRVGRGCYDDLLEAPPSQRSPRREEPPLDLAAVEALAMRRRERAAISAPIAGSAAPSETPPPSSARRLDHARLAFREVDFAEPALDDVIVSDVAEYFSQEK